jgi:hypothetical protein
MSITRNWKVRIDRKSPSHFEEAPDHRDREAVSRGEPICDERVVGRIGIRREADESSRRGPSRERDDSQEHEIGQAKHRPESSGDVDARSPDLGTIARCANRERNG